MDGLYPDLQLCKMWYLENFNRVTPNNFVTNHVDELIGQTPKNQIIPICLEILQTLVSESKNIGDPVRITLILSLISNKKKISFRIPKTMQAVSDELDIEPPSFYLQSWEAPKRFVPYEEYRVPVGLEISISNASCINISYREFRNGIVLKNKWEFGRCIDFEYFPEGYDGVV